MRRFGDEKGRHWDASVSRELSGVDYKGQYFLVMRPADQEEVAPLPVHDVRWNSKKTAERTLRTMSTVELQRRLRQAAGRAGAVTSSSA